MKTKNLGSLVRVTVSASEVASFADSWPCSGFVWGDRATFDFERRNGDLVGVSVNGRAQTPQRITDSALCALADDCKAFANL